MIIFVKGGAHRSAIQCLTLFNRAAQPDSLKELGAYVTKEDASPVVVPQADVMFMITHINKVIGKMNVHLADAVALGSGAGVSDYVETCSIELRNLTSFLVALYDGLRFASITFKSDRD